MLMTVLTLTTGSAFIMWLGEQISERGIGNGMSLIIFVGIVVGLPRAIFDLYDKFKTGAWGVFTPLAIILLVFDGCGHRLHHLCRGWPAPHPGAVRQACCRTPCDGRSIHISCPARQLRWCHSAIFASSLLAFPVTPALMLGSKYAFIKKNFGPGKMG